jgi:hypothetical protein
MAYIIGFLLQLHHLVLSPLMHVKCQMMIDTRSLFDEMPGRKFVLWNTIIEGLLDSGDYLDAF